MPKVGFPLLGIRRFWSSYSFFLVFNPPYDASSISRISLAAPAPAIGPDENRACPFAPISSFLNCVSES